MERVRVEAETRSPEETEALGRRVGRVLGVGDVLALHGELGAGKTCFVRGLAAGLGQDPRRVASPTFVIAHQYEEPSGVPLVHIDAYRLAGSEELDTIGWERLVDGSSVVAVEWPGRIEGALEALPRGLSVASVRIGATGATSRRVAIDAPGAWGRRPGWGAIAGAGVGGAGTTCPICGRAVAAEAAAWPFDTERCRMADLGRWMSGAYVVRGKEGEGPAFGIRDSAFGGGE